MQTQGNLSRVAQNKNSKKSRYYLSRFATDLGKERCQSKLLLQPGRQRGGKLRQDALQTLKCKRTKQEKDGPSSKKAKFNLEKIWQQKQELKNAS